MSQETMKWLNTNTLVGYTDKRGNAWHYRAEEQGEQSNHYPGPIPVEDVRRRLFDWNVLVGDVTTTALTDDGVFSMKDPSRQTMIRPPRVLGDDDQGEILGIFKAGYKAHDYQEWLLDNVATILDDELGIGSAGLLKRGGVAFVGVEVPETIRTPEGVEFRPVLFATTSFDGSLSSTYGRSVTLPVCDNTLSAALGQAAKGGQRVKVRHSTNSLGRITDVRQALAVVHTIADDFAAQVAELCDVKVSDGDWAKFLDTLVEVPEKDGSSKTQALNKRHALDHLYRHDERVTPWAGSAFGVVQAVNTYTHHKQTVRNVSRVDRNLERAVTGGVDKLDASTLETLEVALAR